MNLKFLVELFPLGYFNKKNSNQLVQRINQLEEENGQLRSELKARKQRARILAHDSNNFLYQVDSTLELAASGSLDKELVGLINAVRLRMDFFKTLIDEMLSDEPSQIRRDPIDVLMLVESIRKYYRVALDTKIELVCDADNTEIHSDCLRLSQIINNLLSNAVRFSPPDGQIELIIKSSLDSVELIVWDEGPGLSERQINNLFVKKLSPTNGGHGFGLKIVGDLVKQLGGQIKYNYDDGAVFTVSLPIN